MSSTDKHARIMQRQLTELRAELAETQHFLVKAIAVLSDSSAAWEGEEDSVKEEHAELITAHETFFADYRKSIICKET